MNPHPNSSSPTQPKGPLDSILLTTGLALLVLSFASARNALPTDLPWPEVAAVFGFMLLVAAWRPWPLSYPLWAASGVLLYKLVSATGGASVSSVTLVALAAVLAYLPILARRWVRIGPESR